jgi:NAD(P)-dependent dehydrogenase (short-subunit alcohol dehydrogenase family)
MGSVEQQAGRITMSPRYEDKVVLVTGGTSGIGRETAIAFAREGASVMITGRRAGLGAEVVAEIEQLDSGRCHFLQADVTNLEDIQRMVSETVSKFGRLDVAFNNAGLEGDLVPLTEQTPENYEHVFSANVRGVLFSMKYEIPAMLKTGGGSIINNASIAGLIGMPGLSVYAASKHAVIGLTKSASLEWGKEGVRINAVAPAAIETEMFERFTGGDDDARAQFAGLHPIGRVGKPHEIASAVLWLGSDEASFMVGHTLTVDGGFTAQ